MLSDDYLSKLFASYDQDMLRLACRYLRNYHDAEDVVGDCWASVMAHKAKLEEMDVNDTRSYLMRCVVNGSIDFLRKKKRQAVWMEHAVKDMAMSTYTAPEDSIIDRMMLETFYETLPWREAEIFVLKMQGLSFPMIATQLGISPSTARSYWWRVMKKLRKLTKEANTSA